MSSLHLRDVSWSPREAKREAPWLIDAVDLSVRPGEFVGLIGPNGSGKTSVLRCAYRFNTPLRGGVRLDGQDLGRVSERWTAQRIAVVLQEFPQEFGLTVEDVVRMGRIPHKRFFDTDGPGDEALVKRALQAVGMGPLRRRVFEQLSGGEKQRALVARALAQEPTLLILDEPTNHLDPRFQIELLRLLRGLRLSTLASFHDLNLAAAFCDRLYAIQDGRIVAQGTPEAVLTAERVKQLYGLNVIVDRHPYAHHPRLTWIT
ncbi:ABC transporter ATP-binding protein [Stutzerimonas azotifigens]|uniref:ABC transporter ATP-binding protein n=1 Tax=Stutzerimonas azotifigens TaxID=291995 RepID=A0ABR5Z695_9GAMM|nr:ABC transporter ATP-binding protein [Stutzerimonas azotifigens]MBA1275689.1 ABC transporter ATP-binding protein [Stutzerimonas azotifigens]